jgi:hypothetical protein
VFILKLPRPLAGLITGSLATLLAACATAPRVSEPARAPLAPAELRAPNPSAQTVPLGEPATTPRAQVNPVVWRPDRPLRYTVRKGDTLWEISARFLRDPWRWPEVWHANPQVRNPHRIYPGDVLEVALINGQTVLQPVEPPLPDHRLSPEVRREALEEAIPALPYGRIAPFLAETAPVDTKTLEKAPYLLGPVNAEQLIMGAGDRVYVRGTDAVVGTVFQVVSEHGVLLQNPDTDKPLGSQVEVLGVIRLIRAGDPAEAVITQSRQEMRAKNRLLPAPETLTTPDLLPRAPNRPVSGRILVLSNAISQTGQYQSVTLGLGSNEGLEVGHVLTVYRSGAHIPDPVLGEQVALPEEAIGEVLIFRVFEGFSQGLIVRSTRSIVVGDRVANPP